MAYRYHTLQHWNQWLSVAPVGLRLLNAEVNCIKNLLANHYGKHCALVGVPSQKSLLEANKLPIRTLISPITERHARSGEVEADVHELPIFSGSIDLVILPHTLEFVSNPRHVLIEACRIVKPEGLLVYIGFNPISLWGVKRYFSKTKDVPWSGRFIPLSQIKNWLKLKEFEEVMSTTTLHQFPCQNEKWFDRLHLLDKIGPTLLPAFGGVSVLVARAKVIPLTPIRMRWKQKLSAIELPSSLNGTIARQTEIVK